MSDHAQQENTGNSEPSSVPVHHRFPQYLQHLSKRTDSGHNTRHNLHSDDDDDDDQEEEQEHRVPAVKYRSYLTRKTTQARIEMPVKSTAYLCGLLAGVTQAGIFSPYDRALYLSVKENRSFLSWKNWQSPYNGFFQSIGGRALSGGLYFPLEHFFLHLVAPLDHSHGAIMSPSFSPQHLFAGIAAGAANAVVLNPLSAIKYRTWSRIENRGMWNEAMGMLHKAGGLRPFWNGLYPTLYRDVVFGGCYTYLRFKIQRVSSLEQWQANIFAAALATIASGPFNYVRNIQYATKSRERALSTWMILHDLWWDAVKQPSLRQRAQFILTRLRIGWGTARVALGMSLGHSVYDLLHDQLTQLRMHTVFSS